jgi:hypothetical protein
LGGADISKIIGSLKFEFGGEVKISPDFFGRTVYKDLVGGFNI